MDSWKEQLRADPIPVLQASGNKSIEYFVRRDLLEEEVAPLETLWKLPEVDRNLRRQREDGSWKYPGGKERIRSKEDYDQLETFRVLGQLVEKHGLNKQHPAIMKAAGFLFSFQTEEGDFRGIYGNQYTPNYTGAIMEQLIKSGYGDDPRIEKGFEWLLSVRQGDGGWAIPLLTAGAGLDEETMSADTVEPDSSKPFSHMVTGMVLRSFAAHERYKRSEEAVAAGDLLASRFFKRDAYPGRNTPDFWTRVSYPFWFTDIVSSLDSLSLMGFECDNPQVNEALDWLKARQEDNGLFGVKLLRTKDKDLKFWVCLAICRVFKRFYGS